jgi:hypothetical protein
MNRVTAVNTGHAGDVRAAVAQSIPGASTRGCPQTPCPRFGSNGADDCPTARVAEDKP